MAGDSRAQELSADKKESPGRAGAQDLGALLRNINLRASRDDYTTLYLWRLNSPDRRKRKYLRENFPSRARSGPPQARQVISRSLAGPVSARTT